MHAHWCLFLGLAAIAAAAPVDIELAGNTDSVDGLGALFGAVANYDFDDKPTDAFKESTNAIDDPSIFGDRRATALKKVHAPKGPRDNAVEQSNAVVATEQVAQDTSQANEAAKKPPKSHAGSHGRKKEYDEDEISVQPDEEEKEEEEEPSAKHDSHSHYGGGRHGSQDDAEYYNDAVEHVLKHACSNRGVKEGCSVGTLKGKCVEKSTSGVKLCSA